MRSFYDHVCGQIIKYFCLCTHKHMASLTLNLKAIIHAGKCDGRGWKSEEPWLKWMKGN